MYINRALNDFYVFSARFLQLCTLFFLYFYAVVSEYNGKDNFLFNFKNNHYL